MNNIKVEITLQDCIEYSKEIFDFKNIKIFYAVHLLIYAIAIIGIIVGYFLDGLYRIWLPFLIICIGFSILYGNGSGEIIYNSFKNKVIKYQISNNAIVLYRDNMALSYNWNNVLKIYETQNLIIFFVRINKIDVTGFLFQNEFLTPKQI